uniref:ATP synthase complex subunit 8 n=1 Tax=Pristurus rupestris rupestris TaxID=1530261 RepID=A0A343SA20_9SAUR|nr:ATP synthase F0 subunit 8 [Pristurus rupestris rupestris]
MPQLNPLPWFMILTSTWAIFLFVLPQKFRHLPPTNALPNQQVHHTHPIWSWPWY